MENVITLRCDTCIKQATYSFRSYRALRTVFEALIPPPARSNEKQSGAP